MSTFIVYSLIDPRSGSPFYIGFTSRGTKRIKEHIRCNGSNTIKSEIVKDIIDSGLLVDFEVLLETDNETEALEFEKHQILKYGRIDIRTGILSNKCSGGQGTTGRIVSDKEKKHLRELRYGKSYECLYGSVKSEIIKSKISDTMMGSSNHMYGKKHSEKSKDKIKNSLTVSNRTFSMSEDHKNKISESNRHRTVSDETKTKMRDAALAGSYNKAPRTEAFKESVSKTKKKQSAEKKKNSPKYTWFHELHGTKYMSRYELCEHYPDLSISELGQVLRGKFLQHKGWRLN